MKEIKFRVWDNEDNKYFEPIYEAYKGNLLDLSIGLGGRLLRRTLQLPAEDESMFKNRYLLEQFTGLTDKNGKDIYEGDIIAVDDLCVNPLDGWKDGEYTIVFETCQFLADDIHNENTGMELFQECCEYEVIGTIHEDKHLLK